MVKNNYSGLNPVVVQALNNLQHRYSGETPEMWCFRVRYPFKKLFEYNPKYFSKNGFIQWINLAGHRKYVLQQARMEVLSMCNIIKRKPITDKQLLYLYNMVIIPRIEYRTQLTILSKRDCDSIIAPFRQLYKNKFVYRLLRQMQYWKTILYT